MSLFHLKQKILLAFYYTQSGGSVFFFFKSNFDLYGLNRSPKSQFAAGERFPAVISDSIWSKVTLNTAWEINREEGIASYRVCKQGTVQEGPRRKHSHHQKRWETCKKHAIDKYISVLSLPLHQAPSPNKMHKTPLFIPLAQSFSPLIPSLIKCFDDVLWKYGASVTPYTQITFKCSFRLHSYSFNFSLNLFVTLNILEKIAIKYKRMSCTPLQPTF